jgi:uncharacterized protein YndB with AHSA1/START domain
VLKNRIEKKVWIQASAEIIFLALTKAKALEQWFCDKASSNPRAEGELIAQWNDEKNRRKGRAVFTRFDPPKGLTLQWVDDGRDEGAAVAHRLSYEIYPRSGMTELVMTDSDETDIDEETLDFLARGWNTVLLELKDYCEHKERAAKKTSRGSFADRGGSENAF